VTAFTETYVEVIVETRDATHLEELQKAMKEKRVRHQFHSFKFHELSEA
jgi:hypothetical protein